MLNGFKASYSDGLRQPLVFDPGWFYYLWDLTYRWRSTDHIYSMLYLADDMRSMIHTCIGSGSAHQQPGLPNTFKHMGI